MNNIEKKITADGGISTNKNISLAIITADCAPVFLYDSDSTLICALHIGWKGCLNNIIKNAINKISRIQESKKNNSDWKMYE